MRKRSYPIIFALIAFLLSFQPSESAAASKPERANILLIYVDDLRPELGCYGKEQIKSPNIDRLARSGILFSNAFANHPVCGPSRASLLSGIYPGTQRWPRWNCSQDEEVPGVVSLPMHFRHHGYQTISLGKIYNNFDDGMGSWDRNWRPPITTSEWDYQSDEGIQVCEEINRAWSENTALRNYDNLPKPGLPFERPNVPDNRYHDGRLADRAIEELQQLQAGSNPFFLAVGFQNSHLPFNAPERYWEMYKMEDLHLPSNRYFPEGAPEAAMLNWGELRTYAQMPMTYPLPDTLALLLLHGYYACVSYVDAQIGRVLNALEDLGLAEKTIVILVGDSGWFLGEHGFWTKHANFREAAHAPLIVRVPWKSPGLRCESLVEFVDVYPTLCELAGISIPFQTQGVSFVTLLDNPEMPVKEAVFYRFEEAETIVTRTHAYTAWFDAESGEVYARMLYDHRNDPGENINIALNSENAGLVGELHKILLEHRNRRNMIIIK